MIYDICIIGAGQSGLVTCKTFSEKTQSILVLEKDASNGMFSFIKEKNLFYWSTSRFMSGFSDFPMNKNIPVWFTIQQYVDYLNSYKNIL
jgi:cation diffusion facilitator CzcD-associated flavoprotein CzcO